MKLPSVNVQGSTPGRFCSEHMEEGMENVVYKRYEYLTVWSGLI